MITLRYPAPSSQQEGWKEKLDSLIVAYELVEDHSLSHPEISENGRTVKGEAAIDAFLKQLEKDIDDWRAPGCGV